jgi:hypothetical protein
MTSKPRFDIDSENPFKSNNEIKRTIYAKKENESGMGMIHNTSLDYTNINTQQNRMNKSSS